MPSARQVPRDEDVAMVIQLPGLPVDGQVSQDRLRRQLSITRQGCLGRGAYGADDRIPHTLNSLTDLGEIVL